MTKSIDIPPRLSRRDSAQVASHSSPVSSFPSRGGFYRAHSVTDFQSVAHSPTRHNKAVTSDLAGPLLQQATESKGGYGASTGTGHELEALLQSSKRCSLSQEVIRQCWIAGPMIGVNLLQYSITLLSVMFVGHLGELELASASIATSLASVVGYYVLLGMGARPGNAVRTSLRCHAASHAGRLPPTSLAGVIHHLHTPVLRVPLHVGHPQTRRPGRRDCREGGGVRLVPLAQPVRLRALAARGEVPANAERGDPHAGVLRPDARHARSHSLHVYFPARVGLPWGGYGHQLVVLDQRRPDDSVREILWGVQCNVEGILQGGFGGFVWVSRTRGSFLYHDLFGVLVLPKPQLEISALSVCISMVTLNYMIPFGLSAAASTRVSNELGAGNAGAAKYAVHVVMSMSAFQASIVGCILVALRFHFGWLYSNDAEVVHYVGTLMPFVACIALFDGIQGVLSGVARGCGRQELGAYINLCTFYVIGVPTALVLAFYFNLGGRGLFTGLLCGLGTQMLTLSIVTLRTDWDKQVQIACKRVLNDEHEKLEGFEKLSNDFV